MVDPKLELLVWMLLCDKLPRCSLGFLFCQIRNHRFQTKRSVQHHNTSDGPRDGFAVSRGVRASLLPKNRQWFTNHSTTAVYPRVLQLQFTLDFWSMFQMLQSVPRTEASSWTPFYGSFQPCVKPSRKLPIKPGGSLWQPPCIVSPWYPPQPGLMVFTPDGVGEEKKHHLNRLHLL